jgi:threonine dehydrogenase-like Zn-dependent dehydrogenase
MVTASTSRWTGGPSRHLRPLHAYRPSGRHGREHRRARRADDAASGGALDQEHHDTTGLVSGSTIPTLLQLVRHGRIEPEKLATHHFKLKEITQAYDVFAAAGENDAPKIVLAN